jgi:hypothetical protein
MYIYIRLNIIILLLRPAGILCDDWKHQSYHVYLELCRLLCRLFDYSTTKLYRTTELLRDATAYYIIGGCRQDYASYIYYVDLHIQ